MKKIIVFLVLAICTGCASNLPLVVKQDLVKQFKHSPQPSPLETHIYVIRGPAWEGGGYGLEVGIENKLVTSLSSGSYDVIKTENKFNNLYLSQFGKTFQHKLVDNRQGEVLFYYFNPETGEFNEVRPALGKSLVMQTQKTSSTPSRDEADFYYNSLMNPSVVGINFKNKEHGNEKFANKDLALLNISRPSVKNKKFELAIWSKNDFIGVLSGEENLQILLPEGKHRLYTYINKFSPIDVDVESGKAYYAKIDIEKIEGTGFTPWKLTSKWTAYNASNKLDFFNNNFKELPFTSIDKNKLSVDSNKHRINSALMYLQKSIKGADQNTNDVTFISKDMGI